jgi:acyl-CoA synthetase (AMP-forming)/AMP-acid ligase II
MRRSWSSEDSITQHGVLFVVIYVAVAGHAADAADAVLVADCGAPVAGTRLRIVDEGRRELPEGHVGDVWIQGSSVTRGYYNLPDETRSALWGGG